ncbi:phospholipase A and acyltransferase 3-like [Haliotis rubra]|uniref:phospholipase A and acyltransferase 3-like n=1 Tax=Haliotis rubra TaxID=36100 RepID=UPI001EE4FE27|nr:phospholipase A and acyltransferase 3-like [Haliotis rubra]
MATMATTQEHNDAVLSSLEPGDQVEFGRVLYSHWGVYIGDGYVIHLASLDGESFRKTEKAVVRRDKIQDVAKKCKMNKNNSKGRRYRLKTFSKSEIVERAKSQLGRRDITCLPATVNTSCRGAAMTLKISDQVNDGIELTTRAAEMFFDWLLEKTK